MKLAVGILAALVLWPAASASAAPACFAAAARDPELPCYNPALRYAARPGLERSLLTPSYPCSPGVGYGDFGDRASGALVTCDFATPADTATRSVALIGDSHAMAWRAAVAGAFVALGWHGIDMTRSHCAFSTAVRDLPDPRESEGCHRFNQRVVEWLRQHPEVTAAVVVHQTGGTPYAPQGGLSEFDTQVEGFKAAWRALPKSVAQVFAIRDNPANHNGYAVARCVRRARRADHGPGVFCARPASESLRPDAFLPAVEQLDDSRYALLDLSPFFCDPTRCLPIVGGALVTKDGSHLTRVFSASLGPYLARAISSLQ